ncbi:MAG: PilZ domain-containing protein [Bdellovibrionales bacterium]|nr:PilZ domain-containing protein [Bdellovibrionales bacterium]
MSSRNLKQHRTRIYRLISLFYLLFPISFLPVAVFLLDIPREQIANASTSRAYLSISFLAIFTGYGLWAMRRWAWYVLHLTQSMVVLLSLYLSHRFGQTNYPIVAFLVICVVAWLVYRRISRELRVPYFMPQIAWWESNPKFRTAIPAQVVRTGGKVLQADIMDLSLAGCFLKCKPEFQENETVEVQCRLFEREWKARGVVLWNTFGAVTHPRGIGVKFSGLDRGSRRVLKAATIKLSKISELNRTRRFLISTEDYNRALMKLKSPLPGGDGS